MQACQRQRTTHRGRRSHVTLVCRLQRNAVDCLRQLNTVMSEIDIFAPSTGNFNIAHEYDEEQCIRWKHRTL